MIRFVVVVTPRGLNEDAAVYLESPDVAELPFEPKRHVHWSDDAGIVHFAGWDHGTRPSSTVDAEGLTAFAGMPRPRGGTWPVDQPLAESIRDRIRCRAWSASELVDAFTVVRLDRDGTGVLACDPLGLHPLYLAAETGVTVMGNRADLVAETAARCTGRPARRDVRAGAWLAFAAYMMADGTGFERARLVPQNTTVHVASGRVKMHTTPAVYAGDPDEPLEDPAVVAEELFEDIADGLRHAIAHSDRRPDLELTGGKDSRVVLAVALELGLVDRFRLVTYGPEGLADTAVAAQIAAELGMEHHDVSALHYRRAASLPVTERFLRHVHRTSGMSFCGDANEPRPHAGLTVSGLLGEPFRTANAHLASEPVASWDDAVRRFRIGRKFGNAGLLRAEVAAEMLELATSYHTEPCPTLRSRNDLHGSWFLRRLPRWQGAIVDLHEQLVRPFYSPARLRSAFGLGYRARTDERVHLALVERVSARLASLPFANDRWLLGTAPASDLVVGGKNAKNRGADSEPAGESRAILDIVQSDPTNPLFELVNPTAARRAAERFDQLPRLEQHQVLGAVSGMIWLGEMELPSRHTEAG